jgi:hypothetical protein
VACEEVVPATFQSAHNCLNFRRTLTMPVRRIQGRMTDRQGPVSTASEYMKGPCTHFSLIPQPPPTAPLPRKNARSCRRLGSTGPIVRARWRQNRRAGSGNTHLSKSIATASFRSGAGDPVAVQRVSGDNLISVFAMSASRFWRIRAELIVSWLKRRPQTVQNTMVPVSSCGSRGDPILQHGQKT